MALRLGGAVVAVGHRVARLSLINLEPRAAGLELVDRDGFDQVTLLRHQLVDGLQRFRSPRAQAADRVPVAHVAMHRGLPRAHELLVLLREHRDVGIQRVQVLVRFGQALRIAGVQRPGERALETSHALLELRHVGAVRVMQLLLDATDAFQHDALVRRRQQVRPRLDQQLLQPLLQVIALLHAQADLRIELPELRVDAGQQRLVVLPAQPDHVLVRIEALLPARHLPAQLFEVQVVLQRCLEVVRSHQLHQVEGLGRIGQRAQADDPALVLLDLLAHQRLEEASVGDALDRGVDLVQLLAEGLQRIAVQHRRATVHVQLAVRVRQRQQRFLHGAVRDFALGEHVPRHHRAFVVLRRYVRPAGAEQRLVRERPVEAHAVEELLRAREIGGLEHHLAEQHVRLVADRERAGVGHAQLSGAIELRDRILLATFLQQRDAEVVRCEAGQRLRALQTLEHARCVRWTAECHVDVRAQELDVVADRDRHLAADAIERDERIGRLVFLEVNAREAIGRFVAHGFVHRAVEHCLDRAAGAMVHAVVELEVADREFRFADVKVQRIALRLVDAAVQGELRIEPLQRLEVVPLVRVIERLAEIQVVQILARARTRGERTRQPEPDDESRARHARYQSPSCSCAEPTVTPRSFGSTPLLNAKCSVRLYSLPVSSLPEIATSIWCSPVGTLPV